MAKLFIIPTPIGNLEDITLRAVRLLKEVDLLLAEDTRTSQFLLKHLNIDRKILSHHKFNEHATVEHVADTIAAGQSVGLVSDAGTPGISDPGFLLVRTCLARGIEVETLPGPTAFVPALVNSGFPCDRFCFEGFLPQKKGRNKRLAALTSEERTLVFYESPFRLAKLLEQLIEYFGSTRNVSVSREISKIYEETVRGTLAEVLQHFVERPPKGEIVVVLQGVEKSNIDEVVDKDPLGTQTSESLNALSNPSNLNPSDTFNDFQNPRNTPESHKCQNTDGHLRRSKRHAPK